jgi:hypothetical protein
MGGSRRLVSLILAAVAIASLAGCTGTFTEDGPVVQVSAPKITPLPTGTTFDYQLGGGYTPPAGTAIVTRDSTDTPLAGLYNICYINAFQTQSEDKKTWLTKHPALVLRSASGKPIFDAGWPDEMILDVSTAAKRKAIAAIQDKTIDLCRSKGFDAVEFDNLDSYSRSHKHFTLSANIAEAELLTAYAHADGLAAGQKNTTELGSKGKTVIGFDFAVAEECYRYDECAAYTSVYGASVLDIEYTDDLRGSFASDCAAPSIPAMTILRDVDLVTPADKGYVYKSCA